MTQRGKAETRAIATHFWQQVDTLDKFWQQTFVGFVEPLEHLYQDPMSAGAAILSRYHDDPSSVLTEMELAPEEFGALEANAAVTSQDIALKITAASSRISLVACAAAFAEALKASRELDQLRTSNPLAFEQLQEERLKRKKLRAKDARPNLDGSKLRGLFRRKS